ncbi:MAG: SPOR domain-containing protein, partial [Catalinimonas sp.]
LYLLLAGLILLVFGVYLIIFTPSLPPSLSALNPFAVFDEEVAPPDAPTTEPRGEEVIGPAEPAVEGDGDGFPTDDELIINNPTAAVEEPPAPTAETPATATPPEASVPTDERAEENPPTGGPTADPVGEASAEPTAEPTAEEPTATPANLARTGRYHLIAGGFGVQRNAEKLKERFERAGFEVTIIPPYDDTKLHKVSVGNFANVREARLRRQELLDAYEQDFWILKY